MKKIIIIITIAIVSCFVGYLYYCSQRVIEYYTIYLLDELK